jgi:phosphonatase-like hydrolase
MEVLNVQRGRDKWTVIKKLGRDKAEEIWCDFIGILSENVCRVREVKGTSDTFQYLRERNVRVVAATGFPAEIAEAIIDHVGWLDVGLIDGWVCSEKVRVSRPDPAMIIHSMDKYGVSDASAVMKIDDTVNGIEEGLNAGAYTIGVLTGTQSIQQLSAARPDAILSSVVEIPDHLVSKKMI